MTHGALSDTEYDGTSLVGGAKERQPSSVRMARPDEVAELEPKPSGELVLEMIRDFGWVRWVNLFREMPRKR